MADDPGRNRPVEVKWVGEVAAAKRGRITIDGELWAYVQWSEFQQAWCIQDAEGECLVHVYGSAQSQSAALLAAEAMIRDGSIANAGRSGCQTPARGGTQSAGCRRGEDDRSGAGSSVSRKPVAEAGQRASAGAACKGTRAQ